jgi:two-component system phosphate regulon sensor histidine kinase PhoR
MTLGPWFRPPRLVLTVFLAVAAVCGTALVWLGWLLLAQDQAVEAQQRRERLEEVADRAVAVLQRALSEVEARLDARNGMDAPPGITLVSVSGGRVIARPKGGLLYYPEPTVLPEAPSAPFAEAERLEFALHDPAGASSIYRRMAESPDVAVRAGALARCGRALRRTGDRAGAIRAYGQLGQITGWAIGGLPVSLVAREGLAMTYEEAHETGQMAREATALRKDLRSGRWELTKEQFSFYDGEADRWTGKSATNDVDLAARTEVFTWIWRNRSGLDASGRRAIRGDGSPALAIWRRSPAGELDAAVAAAQFLTILRREAAPAGNLRWALSDADGRTVFGEPPPSRDFAVRTAASTRLPWTLQLYPAPGTPWPGSPRQPLLLWGFAVLAVVLGAGTYFILHAIARELRVTRLQADFVAAVSHEFRSPLSSMAQISEMLALDRFASEELRRKSYSVLVRETDRLRRLVDGLLDFSRFEPGAAGYRFEPIEAGALVRAVVGEFRERAAADGYAVELTAPAAEIPMHADREALGRAIWNLLDNAVKYSPECRTVWVEVEHLPGRVSIAVRDCGLGIPPGEQREIFERFVRGAESKVRRIKGTGIGLAIVRNIVEAHGGGIRLASQPGQGSRFAVLLRAAGGAS